MSYSHKPPKVVLLMKRSFVVECLAVWKSWAPCLLDSNVAVWKICLFLFLFIWSLSSHSRTFHSCGEVTIAGEGLQILTDDRHSWPLNREGSLTCHTCSDTGLPFRMVIFEDPCHSYLLPNVWQWSGHNMFLRLRSVATGNRTPISHMRGERSTSTPPRRSRFYEISLRLKGQFPFVANQIIYDLKHVPLISPITLLWKPLG